MAKFDAHIKSFKYQEKLSLLEGIRAEIRANRPFDREIDIYFPHDGGFEFDKYKETFRVNPISPELPLSVQNEPKWGIILAAAALSEGLNCCHSTDWAGTNERREIARMVYKEMSPFHPLQLACD